MRGALISMEERSSIQLSLLKEIDVFCRRNNIRYSLACGTLIGAIRHKGYIPWDDDIDIEMPKEDLLRFKREFKSDCLAFYDVDTYPHYPHFFPRVADTRTCKKIGKKHLTYGISIDIYPNIELPDNKEDVESFFVKGKEIKAKCKSMGAFRRKLLRHLSVDSIPLYDIFYDRRVKSLVNLVINQQGYGRHYYFSASGGFGWHNVLEFDPFEELIDVDFEGYKFKSIKRYDEYLRTKYGDYMQLPPVEQRVPYHLGEYYWK